MGQVLDDQDHGRGATTSIGWLLDRWRLAEANFADQDAPGITWEPSDKRDTRDSLEGPNRAREGLGGHDLVMPCESVTGTEPGLCRETENPGDPHA